MSGVETSKKDLLSEIAKLKEMVEYEKQPNIAFEKENDALKTQVVTMIVNLHCVNFSIFFY